MNCDKLSSCWLLVFGNLLAAWISPASADLVTSEPQGRFLPLVGEWRIDVNNDGVDDFEIRGVSIATTDEPSSYSMQTMEIRGLEGNLILSTTLDHSVVIRLSRVGADLPMISRWASDWIVVASTASRLVRADPLEYAQEPWTEPWSEKGNGYIVGTFEAADGNHAVWFQLNFPDGSQGSPELVDWQHDTETIAVDLAKAMPRIRDVSRLEEAAHDLFLDRLLVGHRYLIETTDDLSASEWQVCEEFIGDRSWKRIRCDLAPHRKARFFRVRHEWLSSL